MSEEKNVTIEEIENTPLVLTKETTNYIEAVQGVHDWMAKQSNSANLSLVIDYASDPDKDWYAVITEGDKVVAGETTRGSGFVVDAICALWLELKGKK